MSRIFFTVLTGVIAFSLFISGCVTQSSAQASAGIGSASPSASTPIFEGESNMAVKTGDTVKVDYVGTLVDGTVFDTSLKAEAQKAGLPLRPSYEPLEFRVGGGQMIKGFDDAVLGMRVGGEKTVRIPPAEAYGEKRTDLILEVPRSNINGSVEVGNKLQAANGAVGTVTKVTASNVTIDFNHPLAGQALNFRIILRAIVK